MPIYALPKCDDIPGWSAIRNQSASNHTPSKLIVQDIKIQIHKLKPGHKVRNPPNHRAPFRPSDCVADFRVQVETDCCRRDLERTSYGRLCGGEVKIYVVGG